MDAVFFKAANPPQFRVLGAKLLPLTIGHLFLLRKYCPDIFGEDELSFGAIAVAAFICAHPQEKVEKLFTRRFIRATFEVWGWFCQKRDLAKERDIFTDYLAESMDPPKLWQDLSRPLITCQSPLEMRLLVVLMADFHYTELAAMSVTVAKANALWATFGELKNKFTFADERTEGLFEFAERMRAEKAGREN
jgi:hypothetical protein